MLTNLLHRNKEETALQDPADSALILKRWFEQHHRRVFQIALHLTRSVSDADNDDELRTLLDASQ